MAHFDQRRSRSAATIVLLFATLLAWLLPAVSAEAKPTQQSRCISVQATGTGQDLGGGQTTATIFVRGRPVGSTRAMFTITGASMGVATFAGDIVFTPRGLPGTLVAPVVGTFDLTSGVFTAESDDVVGTGALTGVTGSVSISGTENLTTGAFTETLRTRLCAPPKAPQGHGRS